MTQRIAIDARPLAFPGTGNATYLHRMLRELMQLRPHTTWILLSHRGLHPVFGDLLQKASVEVQIDRGFIARSGALWLYRRVPQILKEIQADLFWATLAMLPYHYRKQIHIPTMVNFHDLNAYVAPDTMVRWNRWQHRLTNQHTLKAADLVLCLSKTTRNDIQKFFPDIPNKRLEVVYPGCELPEVDAIPPHGPVAKLSNFFVCVGTLEPRKNQTTLVAAYLAARKAYLLKSESTRGTRAFPALVLVGRKGWGDESLYNQLSNGNLEQEQIYFLENASDGVLHWAYQNCGRFVLPSLHEGFGLPVVEAYQLGKKAILSDIPIFKEIGGAAIFVAPRDAGAWQKALKDAAMQMNRSRTGKNKSSSQNPAPDFDHEFWSWAARAAHLNKLIDRI